jgi:hypothetical protein
MNKEPNSEVQQILVLQEQIQRRLAELGFLEEDDVGNIAHHLAELTIFGRKLNQDFLPKFLASSLQKNNELAELVVDTNYDLGEMKTAIEEMEPAFIRLMNFLTRE